MFGQTEKGTIEETETETATPAPHLVLRRVQAGEAVPAGDRAAELADVRQQLHPHHTLVTLLSHSGHTLVTLCCHTPCYCHCCGGVSSVQSWDRRRCLGVSEERNRSALACARAGSSECEGSDSDPAPPTPLLHTVV